MKNVATNRIKNPLKKQGSTKLRSHHNRMLRAAGVKPPRSPI